MIEKIWTRLYNTLRVGKVVAPAVEKNGVQVLQVYKSPLEKGHLHQSYQYYGIASSPIVNSTDCVVVQQGGDANRGIIVATNDRNYRPANLQPGEVQIYDNHNQSIKLAGGTYIVVVANSEVEITAPNITINGNLQVNGTINASGDIKSGPQNISLTGHVHPDPQGGNTGLPTG